MKGLFEGFDWSAFWDKSDSTAKKYIDRPVTAEMIASVEATLGYRLPAAYVALANHQNGGIPRRTCHRTIERTSWAEDHIAITGIYAIGRSKSYSLLGSLGSVFWQKQWGYPPIGIYFADCPSAGHDMLCLDYRECGSTGEPTVVHVNQELDYRITRVAKTFERFIRGLKSEEAFD